MLKVELSVKLCKNEDIIAGWSSLVAREAHNLEAVGSNPTPAIFLLMQGNPYSF